MSRGVERDDDIVAGRIDAGHHRGRLAEVAAEADEPEVRMRLRGGAQALPGGVGGPVVHEQDLVVALHRGEGGVDMGGQRGNVLLFVVDGNDDGKAVMRFAHGRGV